MRDHFQAFLQQKNLAVADAASLLTLQFAVVTADGWAESLVVRTELGLAQTVDGVGFGPFIAPMKLSFNPTDGSVAIADLDAILSLSPGGSIRVLIPNVSAAGLAFDKGGNLYFTDAVGHQLLRQDRGTSDVRAVAGTGTPGFSGDGGLAVSAAVTIGSLTGDVAIDRAGNALFCDGTHRIRKIDAATGVISTIAGDGTLVTSGDGGLAINAGVGNPAGLVVDAADNLYLISTGNRIRQIDGVTG